MAARRKFTAKEWIIGIVAVGLSFVIIHAAAGALALDLPQWLLAGVSAAVGVVLWYAFIGYKKPGEDGK